MYLRNDIEMRCTNAVVLYGHRYGSDKRLYHIAETLVGLGHKVSFGGMAVSGFETGESSSHLPIVIS